MKATSSSTTPLFWRSVAAVTTICFFSACNSADYTPQGLDLVLNVSKKLERNADGSMSLKLTGDSLRNPQAAVETFHKLADSHFGSTPYTYSYTVGKERAHAP